MTRLTIIVFCFFYFSIPNKSIAQRIISLQDKIEPFFLKPEKTPNLNLFYKEIKSLRDKELNLYKLKGSSSFGFSGNTTESDNDIYKINGGINLYRGEFPNQFQFSSKVDVLIENGVIKENVSDLKISYDWHPERKLHRENFVFLSRGSNRYLGVDQRYELGGGVIFAWWSKKTRVRKHKNEIASINSNDYFFRSTSKDVTIIASKNHNDIVLRNSNFSQSDSISFSRTVEDLDKSLLKQYSNIRAGVLIGIFFESEQISVADSLIVYNTEDSTSSTMFFPHSFPTENELRWELRPFFDFKILDRATVKIRPYIKFPVPWNLYDEVEGSKELDYRLNVPISLKMEMNSDFEINLNFTWNYDNTPGSKKVGVNESLSDVYLTANKSHLLTSMSIVYKFK